MVLRYVVQTISVCDRCEYYDDAIDNEVFVCAPTTNDYGVFDQFYCYFTLEVFV